MTARTRPDELDAGLLRLLLRDAVRAPSSHNSQPWRFHVFGDRVDLYADHTRALPVVDPEERELVISCGAALDHLCVSLRHHGIRPEVSPFPAGESTDLLARVCLGERFCPTPDDELLFSAIAARHTNRDAFERREVPRENIVALRDAAELEGAWLAPIQEHERRSALAEMIADGDREQWADPAFRDELAGWLRTKGTASDGMTLRTVGRESGMLTSLVPAVIRRFDRGDGEAAHDHEPEGAPLLVVLGTMHDGKHDWLAAGRALSRVLLRATTFGLAASFLNQPIEVPHLRRQVQALVGIGGSPQLLLRIGYGRAVQPTPRRDVEDTLV